MYICYIVIKSTSLERDHILTQSVMNRTNALQVYFSHLSHSPRVNDICQALSPDSGTKLWIRLQPRKGSCLESNTCPSTWEAWGSTERDVFIQKYLHKGNLLRCNNLRQNRNRSCWKIVFHAHFWRKLHIIQNISSETPEWRRKGMSPLMTPAILQNFCASKGQQHPQNVCDWISSRLPGFASDSYRNNSVGENKEIWHFKIPAFDCRNPLCTQDSGIGHCARDNRHVGRTPAPLAEEERVRVAGSEHGL